MLQTSLQDRTGKGTLQNAPQT